MPSSHVSVTAATRSRSTVPPYETRKGRWRSDLDAALIVALRWGLARQRPEDQAEPVTRHAHAHHCNKGRGMQPAPG